MAQHRSLALTLSLLALAWALPAEARRHHRHQRHPPPPTHRPPPHHPYYHPHHPVHVVVIGPAPRVVVRETCPGPDLVWVGGHPGPGGYWVSGHCVRVSAPPRAGWVYVPGYWNGRVVVSGFWRPSLRTGYTWVGAGLADDGAYEAGYWEPEGEGPEGTVWRPGYWDGEDWVAGGWVAASQYETYGPDGELTFFAVGDGVVEDLALPANEELDAAAQDAVPVDTTDTAPLPVIVAPTPDDAAPSSDDDAVRHAEVPE